MVTSCCTSLSVCGEVFPTLTFETHNIDLIQMIITLDSLQPHCWACLPGSSLRTWKLRSSYFATAPMATQVALLCQESTRRRHWLVNGIDKKVSPNIASCTTTASWSNVGQSRPRISTLPLRPQTSRIYSFRFVDYPMSCRYTTKLL